MVESKVGDAIAGLHAGRGHLVDGNEDAALEFAVGHGFAFEMDRRLLGSLQRPGRDGATEIHGG